MSGFLKLNESIYDYFGIGYSSMLILVVFGIVRVRDLNKEDYKVIVVIGDGVLIGGMVFEVLNDVGFRKINFIVILNDN